MHPVHPNTISLEPLTLRETKQVFRSDCKHTVLTKVFVFYIGGKTVLQTHLLQRYAPANALHLLFHPRDTGSPHFDFTHHLQQYANTLVDADSAKASVRARLRLQPTYSGNATRIDLESHQLIGGRVIGRVEIDLGSPDDDEHNYKILAVPYAEKHLGNNDDAVEFVRVIKAAVSAGVQPDPRSLQIWAAWAYDEIKQRYAEVLHNHPGIAKRAATSATDAQALAEFKCDIIRDVLTELNTLAMELTAITTSKEDRLFDEHEVEFFSVRNEQLTPQQRKDLFELRYSELFPEHEASNSFAAELKAICSKLSPAHASGIVYDEESQFQSYLTEVSLSGKLDDDSLEALQASHERVTEQWTEGGVVSLHMSDSERFVVEGTLEEDVTVEYLPMAARDIAVAIRESFLTGTKVFSTNPDDDTIDSYIETALNRIFGDPAPGSNARVNRTVRRVTTVKGKGYPVEYTLTKSVYPNAEEREYCREILDTLIEGMQRDFILRSINRSKLFRTFYNAIDNASDVRSLIKIIKDAYQARKAKTINIKMFTALNTLYAVKRARLDSTLLRLTNEVGERVRTTIPAVPVIELARTIPTKQLRQLAIAIHTLPDQEPEKIARFLKANRPGLYNAILSGLLDIVEKANYKKCKYLLFAFYKNRETGHPNEPHNMIHLLTTADAATVWKRLLDLSAALATQT
jgi:hypothetical protein